jgi:hypothetical protein
MYVVLTNKELKQLRKNQERIQWVKNKIEKYNPFYKHKDYKKILNDGRNSSRINYDRTSRSYQEIDNSKNLGAAETA